MIVSLRLAIERIQELRDQLECGETLDAEPAFGPSGGLYTNPAYSVFNIGGSWRVVRQVEIFARALNLFDRRYEEVFGYPAPGRTGYVGARVAVGR